MYGKNNKKELYTNFKANTLTDKEGSYFPIEKGVEQSHYLRIYSNCA